MNKGLKKGTRNPEKSIRATKKGAKHTDHLKGNKQTRRAEAARDKELRYGGRLGTFPLVKNPKFGQMKPDQTASWAFGKVMIPEPRYIRQCQHQ